MSDSSDSSEASSVSEEEFEGPSWRQEIGIVVIHGDEGKKERPTDLENAQPLQDLLSGRIREIRAKITFEYDVEATFGADKSPGFDEAAVSLLETIWRSDNERNNETGAGGSRDTSVVPLVMIAYGLGGRIVQRGLCMARRSLKYRSIELRTELLIFVGTPQYTPDYDKFMDGLVWGEVRREFLSIASRYRILSIYQDLEIRSSEDSSSEDSFFLDLPTEKRLTRKTRPIDLGQFYPEDEELKSLTRDIKSLLKPKHFDGYYGEYVAFWRSLNMKKGLKIYQDKPMAQSKSFGWIEEENTKVESWLSEPASRIFLVSGDEDSGMRPASQHLMEEAEKRYKESAMSTVSASFTFDSFDDRFNTLEALLTSLVFQLLLADPTLFSFLADVEASSVADMLSGDTNEPAVSRLWRLMKTLLSYRGRCAIVCGINALQDCKSDYTTVLEDLISFSSVSEANFKIIITSVHDGARLKIPFSIALDQEKAMELQRYEVMESVSALIRTKPVFKEFEGYLASRISEAIGTNFWQANLYLKYLERSMTHTTPKSVRSTMTLQGTEPAQSIISRTLHRLTDHDQNWSLRMFAWVVYGFRPLELPELATAMALDFVDPVSSAQGPVSLDRDPIDDWYSRDISADIQLTLGGIVEIRGTEVSIANLHLRQAVIEELGRRANIPDSSSKEEREKSEATELSKNINHLTIAQICLGYLSVERMESVCEFLDGQHLPHSGPYQDNFCMYATQYWPAHCQSIQGPATEVINAIMERLQCPAWIAAWRKLDDHLGCLEHSIPEIPDFQAPVSFYCASLGLRAALEVALGKEVQMIDDESKDIILMAATRSGNLETVKYLLSKFDYQQDYVSKSIAEPLISGNQAVISQLLKRFQWEQGSPVIAFLLEQAAYMNGPSELIQNVADQLNQHQSDLTNYLHPALLAAIKVGNKAVAEIILTLKSSGIEANESATDEESQTRSYPSSLLHLAVASGNVDLLSMLVSENLPIDLTDGKKRTPLHLASMLSYQSMVRHLISTKIDVNAIDIFGRTALHYAALMGHLEIVRELLLQEDMEINMEDLAGDTPLLLATKMRQREVVEELLEKKASSRKRNKLKEAALHIAIRNADESIVQLIAAAEDVNLEAKAKDSCTPLLLAAEYGHLDIFKHLLSRGAKQHVRGSQELTTLHLAAKNGHVALAEFLIQNGADIECLDDGDSRPLHLAAKAGHVALVKVLLEHNADIESEDCIEQTPLILASAAGNVETVRCLLNHGGRLDQRDDYDCTALSVAAFGGYRQIVEILLEAEAAESDEELKWEQADLNTALQAAIRGNHLAIVERLLLVGADIKSKDRDGDSSLCNAMYAGSVDMAKFVLGYSVDVKHTNEDEYNALHLAINRQIDALVQLLLEARVDLNISDDWLSSHLDFAARYGTLASFSMLLDAIEDITVRLKANNATCMYVACEGRKSTSILSSEDTVERIKLLEKKGTNIKVLGGRWGSPLHTAIATRHKYKDAQSLDVMDYLLSRGASITDEDEQGRSAVHIAASTKGSLDSFIKILGRDPNGLTRQDTQGRTVWHHAATAGNLRVLRYISRLICSNDPKNEKSSEIPKDSRIKDAISQSDKHGWTPLMWSGKTRKHEVVSFLVDYGADVDHISQMGWNVDHVATYHGQKNVKLRKRKAREKRIKLQKYNLGVVAYDDDDDGGPPSDSDADDGLKEYRSASVGTALVDGKPIEKATRSTVICGGCATRIYGPVSRCEDGFCFCFKCSWTQQETHPGRTFELLDKHCKQGEMPPAPATDSAQVVCTVPLPVTGDLLDSAKDLMFSS
ncbi:ANK_REP_REGION domain-containing protein [Trichoderma simmonsii]|uniref:ANK_REP_REGION domain-containing protein n=1 Tax=Trichoderma simmonsii TaxID=1491479 RepID=A0A8G0PKI0_9HYPO|nr:ANK_REP_REGION domain-containing protein [Trichoderma simmonsii]